MKKKMLHAVLSLLILALLVCALPGCRAEQPDLSASVRVSVLSGTTGFGMAPLISNSVAGTATLSYSFSVETDASVITAALLNGSVDIAALPTNAASVLYNKTNGGVQVLALNTLGVLYLLDSGNGIASVSDLKGKTVAVPAQNPTYIFTYICEQNGLTVATVQSGESADVLIDNAYATPAELQANVISGKVTLAVLPEPLVTVTKAANAELTVALDLTAEWDKFSAGTLVQGCVVVRTAFAEEHPAIISAFLQEYEASIAYVLSNPSEASEMIVSAGIFAKAPVAAKAIPNCNLCFITGDEMKSALSSFLSVMLTVQPASVGGALPGDDFYYIVK